MIEFIALVALGVLALGLGVLAAGYLLMAVGCLVARGVRRSRLVGSEMRHGEHRSPDK